MSTESKVKQIISTESGAKLDEIKLDHCLVHSLGMDSLDIVEAIMEIEEEFEIEITDGDINGSMTVQDMIKLVDAAV
jgi:acyl carrier protein